MPKELSAEEVFDNDKDPLEAIREIRRAEGVDEDELPDRSEIGVAETDILQDKEDEQNADQQTADSEQEQSDAEKDSDAGQEEETVDDSSKNDSDSKAADGDDEADSDSDSDTSNNKEEKTDTKKEEGPVTHKFKANGQEFEFSEEEILAQFETVFGQAMNYTQKMQKIAPYRKMISALELEGITHDSLNLAIDALKGDKGAINELLKRNNLDSYDLKPDDEDSEGYVPKVYGKDETVLEIEEITSTIQQDKEFAITSNVIDEQWDAASRQMIASNPKMILGLHNDIKSGLYDQVAPAAMKMKVLDGNTKSDIEYYMLAGEQLRVEMENARKKNEGQAKVDELNADAQGADSEFDKASSEAERKRAASSTGARADAQRKGVIDYLDDDDEAFEEWYNKLQSSI